ncbi:hypothetical protein Tdes44962_MAKER07837 [Teratosphaeria destructans]|uniref:BRCT domain-containing protein n=1 Tax=Teratosphaeria destructans TaxID=418781 RepID=A0A9W7SY85_9PEZI|nr:hypothetical protein Tdes44962_MAKER07837 [Teratosphaeria destructans]
MVATRRNALKEPEPDTIDPEMALRKKPVRKAAVRTKKAESVAAPEPPKARTTRGRKAAASPAPEERVVVESSTVELSMQARPTRRVGRPAKAQRAPSVAEKMAPASAPATKATRAVRNTAPRSKKTEVRKEQEREASEVEEQPKPTARRTRATATAIKPQPLSPKKITQVSRPQTCHAKAAPTKNKTAKATPTVRTTRKRAVSDENEEVPTLHVAADIGEEDDLVLLASTPVKRPSPVKLSSVRRSTEEADEEAMSSRPTTPSDSPAPSFDDQQDENEYHKLAKPGSTTGESEDEDDAMEEGASEDELCGPKTPMKRTSPGREARYLESVQRSIRRAETHQLARTPPSEVPLRRKVSATPQTQSALSKRRVPTSEVRPTSVARDADRAMVSRQLQPLSPAAEDDAQQSDDQDDALTTMHGSAISEDEAPAPIMTLQNSPASPSIETPELHMPEDTFDDDSTDLEDVVPYAECEDPDGTVLLHETEADGNDVVAPAMHDSPGSAYAICIDQVVDQSLLQASTSIGEDEEPTSQVAAPQTPETIPWDNIRQDVTIPFDFDAHFANVTLAPEAKPVDLDAAQISIHTDDHEERRATTGDDIANGLECMDHMTVDEPQCSPCRDVTMNMNEFIDLAELSESTQAIELPISVSAKDISNAGCSDLAAAALECQKLQPGAHGGSQVMASNDVEENLAMLDPLGVAEVDAVPTETGEADHDISPGSKNQVVQAQSAASQDEENESTIVDEEDRAVPHYALTTCAFDVRRKSLPAFPSILTPVRNWSRPTTSDGASMPRVVNPFNNAGWSRSRATSRAGTPYGTPSRQQTRASAAVSSSSVLRTAPHTPQATPSERYPTLGARRTYEKHAKTAMMLSRFKSLVQTPVQRSNSAQKLSASAFTPRVSTLRPRPVYKPSTPAATTPTRPSSVAFTPSVTASERFPRLGARNTYQDHAKTIAGPTRFSTPAESQAKRPDTMQKHGSRNRIAFKNSTSRTSSNTPMKTPLKPAAMTPGIAPMTPHPSAPLRGVVAMVEVYTNEGASASAPFISQLQRLGAKTTKVWSDRVTHVVFKDGSPTTLQRVRLHNKEVQELGNAPLIYCVNSRWISACDDQGRRVPESSEDFAVDLDEVPRGGRRRRKSMEPSALVNMSGSIFRDRRGSVGRSSLGRSPSKFESTAKRPSPAVETPKPAGPGVNPAEDDKENSGAVEASSPVTPAYLAAPDKLLQQTAPVTKMRKLGTDATAKAKNRRLTYFPNMA